MACHQRPDVLYGHKSERPPTHEGAKDFQMGECCALKNKTQWYGGKQGERCEFFPKGQKPIEQYQRL